MLARTAFLLLVLVPPLTARDRISISSPWHFQVDIDDLGEKERWQTPGFDTAAWSRVSVPGAWDFYNPALRGFEGIGWYATTLDPALAKPGRVQWLRFGRVMYHTRAWLNGEYLGENIGGYLPFEFDVTGKLRADAVNRLVLRVDNRPRLEWLPASRNIEWVQYGGILEPVLVETAERSYLDDVTIVAEPDGTGGAVIACDVKIASRLPERQDLELTVGVTDLRASDTRQVQVQPGESNIRVTLQAPRARPWSPASPVLYKLRVTLSQAGRVVDSETLPFGIRKIATRGRRILLNGEPIQIQGVNRYDEYGDYGPNAPRERIVEDLRRMKAVGVNTVRVHYPQSPELIDLYDAMGFLMSEEVTINWWGNGFSGTGREIQSGAILTHAMPFLERMIRRDKNHPSIVIWSMCNESKTDNEVGIGVMRKLLARARELDRTRLRTFVINNRDTDTHRAFEDADLVAFNVYVGGYQGKPANHTAEVRALIGKAAEEHIRKQLGFWPGKPLLVTEYGTPGIPGMQGDVTHTEEYQAALIEEVGRVIQRTPDLAGGILWSWADYYHRPNYIKYAPFGPYGVVTVDRKPKCALKSLINLYGGRKLEP